MENISAYCLTEGKLFLCTNKHKVDEKIYWNFAYQIILEKKNLDYMQIFIGCYQ